MKTSNEHLINTQSFHETFRELSWKLRLFGGELEQRHSRCKQLRIIAV